MGGRFRRKREAPVDSAELLRLRAAAVELQWDLGGLAYEMAIRDDFRVETLRQRAARLKEVETELAEVERRLEASPPDAATSVVDEPQAEA